MLEPQQTISLTIQAAGTFTTTGIYTSNITIDVIPDQEGFPVQIPLRLIVVEQINTIYLPFTIRP